MTPFQPVALTTWIQLSVIFILHLVAGLLGAASIYMMIERWYPTAVLVAALEIIGFVCLEFAFLSSTVWMLTRSEIVDYIAAGLAGVLVGAVAVILVLEPEHEKHGQPTETGENKDEIRPTDPFDKLNL